MVDPSYRSINFGCEGTSMITTKELYWAAGFMEGEGCFIYFGRPPRGNIWEAKASQVELDPLIRLRNILGGSIRLDHQRGEHNHRQPIHIWATYGARARGVMMTLYSLMGIKRKRTIKKALEHGWQLESKNKTHCPRGHEYTKENTHRRNGKRHCRACGRMWNKKFSKRKLAHALLVA